MGEKKNPSRFTIQFNLNDPCQHDVCKLLEQQGRHKAQFITNAVLHYINYPETSEIPAASLPDQDWLEKNVLAILEEYTAKNAQSPEPKSSAQHAPATNELYQHFDDDDISAIKNTLLAFQR